MFWQVAQDVRLNFVLLQFGKIGRLPPARAEIEIGVAQRQCLARRIATQAEVQHEQQSWAALRNSRHYGTDWRFTTKDARIKLKRLYPSSLLD
ncbi:hypothetical protein FEM03_05970 [Phragmitibacter flavus]|uniref:Uncharacterized protein n=1 Tax=Phragmitibacter flavus TaxID=2576071 RepID=A0A5R8KH83_9BACT|nr:hypothetical protein FEM03_05970 [Phragmitibacter flavus]